MRLARLAHRGRVLAHGFFFGPPLDVAAARARVLGRWRVGARVRAVDGGLVLVLAEPAWVRADAAPGAPLVRCGDALSSAPLSEKELAALGGGAGTIVLARAGRAVVLGPSAGDGDEVDVARWLDAEEHALLDASSLGAPPAPPREAPAPPPMDVRAALGAPAASREVPAMRAALARMRAPRAADGDGAVADARPNALLGLFGGLTRLFAAVLGLALRRAAPAAREASEAAGERALAARPAPPLPSQASLFERLRARALDAAARLLVLARLAQFFQRAHARYLAKMIDMFERGDLDAALRHAVPLDAAGDGEEPTPPALLPGGPRADLEISPWRARARGALGVGEGLFADMRAMYRRAFDKLMERGDVDRAAFVLAELLGASEEAVSLLERHGKHRLAAELAEARGLPPGLVVRQWLIAGDTARALALARTKGAFPDAIARLERSGPPHDRLAVGLRILWADLLADGGAYAAAVDVVWKVEEARALVRAWIERAIAVGGATGGAMLAKKAALPGTFAEVRAQLLALLGEREPEADAARVAFAKALTEGPGTPETRTLARPTARALLGTRSRTLGARRGAALAEQLATFAHDSALRADVRPLTAGPPVLRIRVEVATFTGDGQRAINEDHVHYAHIGARRESDPNVTRDGYWLSVADGTGTVGGFSPALTAIGVVFDALWPETAGERTRDALARGLEAGLVEANRQILERGASDPRMRGAGASATCAALVDGALVLAQVGDTRAYLLRGGRLLQLTVDDSLYEAYRREGKLAELEEHGVSGHHIVTQVLGVGPTLSPRLTLVPLQRGDLLLMTTDGVHQTLTEEELAAPLLRARGATDAAQRLHFAVVAKDPGDNHTALVARFSGADLPSELPPGPWASPYERAAASPDEEESPLAALAARGAARVHERARGDTGALAIHDAALLPGGRLLVALGEIGARLLSPSGRTLAQFGEPAHRLVVSRFGDRALLLASRGDAWRLAKVDLAGKRVQPWCDARFDHFVPTFDEARFFCAEGRRVFAIDLVSGGWDALFHVDIDGAIESLSADVGELRVVVRHGEDDDYAVWRYELAGMTLRARAKVAAPPRFGWSWDVEGEQLTLRDEGGTARVAALLRGASAPRARLDGPELLVWDELGRLLVLSRATGAVLRELRLTP